MQQWPLYENTTPSAPACYVRHPRQPPHRHTRHYTRFPLLIDTRDVVRRPIFAKYQHILCFAPYLPTRCFARRRHEPVQPRIRHLAHRFHLICPYFFYISVLCLYLLRRTTGGPLQASRSWAHPVHASIYIVVPLDLQVVLVNRRRRYGIFATPPTHSRYVYLISIVICTVYN